MGQSSLPAPPRTVSRSDMVPSTVEFTRTKTLLRDGKGRAWRSIWWRDGWNDAQTLLAVLGGMGEGVIVFDLTGRPLYVNSAVVGLYGMPQPLEVTRNLREYGELFKLFDAHGEPIPREAWPVERVLRGERFFNWEAYARPRGGGGGERRRL